MRLLTVVAAVVAATLGAGASPQASAGAPTRKTRDAVVRSYFGAVASQDAKKALVGVDNSASSSHANVFARHEVELFAGFESTRRMVPPQQASTFLLRPKRASFGTNAVTQCTTDKPRICQRFTDFAFDPRSGLLTDFSADGKPLDGRIVDRSDQAVTITGPTGPLFTVHLDNAYVTTQGDLQITIDRTVPKTPPGSLALIDGNTTSYQSPSGTTKPSLIVAYTAKAGNGIDTFIIPNQSFGGHLTIVTAGRSQSEPSLVGRGALPVS